MKRVGLIDISLWFAGLWFGFVSYFPANAFAFSKLKNGFESITDNHLVPLSAAVAGASFILFVILSYFKQEEYQKKVGNVLVLSIFSATGLEIINTLINNFR